MRSVGERRDDGRHHEPGAGDQHRDGQLVERGVRLARVRGSSCGRAGSAATEEIPKKNRCAPIAVRPYAAARRSRRWPSPATSPRSTCRTASRAAGRAGSKSGPSRSRGMRSASRPATAYSTAAVSSTPTSPSAPAASQPTRAPLAGAQAERNAKRAGGRGERVGHDQLVGAHHVRQGRGQPGEQEPVDRQADQDQPEQRRTAQRRRPQADREQRSTSATRTKLDQTSTCRRDQRSSSTPTNGPSTLNGSSTTASAAGDRAG